MVNILESRIKCKQNTYAAFIDFKKAYDHVNRQQLWIKLSSLGLAPGSNIFQALQGIYQNVKSAVKVNGFNTNWFDVSSGLKQGCLLSPLLFNLFINDLVTQIKESCSGIPIGGENVCVLLYADDLVLLARNEKDLQCMLNILNTWCLQWNIHINAEKSQIVHFRKKEMECTNVRFHCGNHELQNVSSYKYLGLLLNEFLDFKVTADHVAKSASRALGLLIAKFKAFGGMPFVSYRKLYHSLVLPIVHYGSAIWGHQQFSSINAVHNKACRYFLGVGEYTPNAAVHGDTGMTPPEIDQWVAITRQWCRLVNMSSDRLNKKIFLWANKWSSTRCKNWVWKTKNFYKNNNLNHISCINTPIDKSYAVSQISNVVFNHFVKKWKAALLSDTGRNHKGGNKLRTYRCLKDSFETESYVTCHLGRKQRSSIARLRCGVAPIRVETGRYEGVELVNRICPFCNNGIEDEVHVLTQCPLYIDLREELYNQVSFFMPDFRALNDIEKTRVLLSSSDYHIIRFSAKICTLILDRRKFFS